DSAWSARSVLEKVARVGANGGSGESSTPIVTDTIDTPWESPWQANAPTASTTYTYSATDPTTKVKYAATFTVSAHLSGASGSTSIQKLADGSTRTKPTRRTIGSPYGLPTHAGPRSPDAGTWCT